MQISSQNIPLQGYQKITDTTVQNSAEVTAATAQHKSTAKHAPAQKDSVNFSNDAKLLAEATRAASTDDGSRAEMVSRLREQVQNGTYVPNERGIAEGILREDSALFAM